VGVLSWLKKQVSTDGILRTTYRLVHPDTRDLFYVEDIRKRTGQNPAIFQGIWMDQTNQIRAEKRLTYRAWKENVSTVTSGLLHDFNNVIAGIFSISELYHSMVNEDHEMYAGLGQIKAGSTQAQYLVRRIMELNREVSGERSIFNLEHLIADQLDFLKAVLPRGTLIEDHFTGTEIPVRLDDVGFRQVLLNLATNARDALGENGRIKITTRRHDRASPGPDGILPSEFHIPAGSAEIVFHDNGCGMPPGVANRAFDPFFSTKEPTRGSGLGLYNAHLFAQANKGRLGVVTGPDRGTAFHLVLPLETFAQPTNDEEPEPVDDDRRMHVLLYSWEDAGPSDLVSRMREASWQVLTVTGADRVREHLTQSVFPIDLMVILRISLDEQADQLLDEIRRAHPAMKIAVITVGDDPEQVPHQISEQADLVLHPNLKLSNMIERLTALIV
jgi:signal transduction histidine kinase